MSRLIASVACGICTLAFLTGCQSTQSPPEGTGFLSDYSRLKQVDSRSLQHVAPDAELRRYQAFLIEPVQVRVEPDASAGMSEAELQELADRMYNAIRDQLTSGYYTLAQTPGAGVAEIRSAITGISNERLRISVEGEILDSVTGDQLEAIVSSRRTSSDARWVVDAWARGLRERLDRARGSQPTPGGELPEGIGFLSTYSNLQQSGPSSLRYIDPTNRLGRYEKFMIHPVVAYFHETGSVVSDTNTKRLTDYMQEQLRMQLGDEYELVDDPAWNVAEIRIALTTLTRSAPVLNAIPRPKISDLGLGGLSMEGEILDSVSNVQIAALVESATGRNLSFDPSGFDDAKAVIRDWAKRVRRAVDEAHERAAN